MALVLLKFENKKTEGCNGFGSDVISCPIKFDEVLLTISVVAGVGVVSIGIDTILPSMCDGNVFDIISLTLLLLCDDEDDDDGWCGFFANADVDCEADVEEEDVVQLFVVVSDCSVCVSSSSEEHKSINSTTFGGLIRFIIRLLLL